MKKESPKLLFIIGFIILIVVLSGIIYVINLSAPINDSKINVTGSKADNYEPFYCKKVIIRDDDILDPAHLPSLRWISNLTIENNIKMTFGVIPESLPYNPKTIDYLNDLNKSYFEFATHGYKHIKFRNHPYNEQYSMIENGTRILKEYLNCRPYTFIPPYSSSDINTTRALSDLGYHSITGMKDKPTYVVSFMTDFFYETWETYLSTPKHRTFKEFKNNFDKFYNSSDEIYILCIHDWTFLDKNKSLNKTKIENFEKVISYFKIKRVQFITIEDAYRWETDRDVIKTGMNEDGEYFIDLKECTYNHTITVTPLPTWNETFIITDKTIEKEIIESNKTIEFDGIKGHIYYLEHTQA